MPVLAPWSSLGTHPLLCILITCLLGGFPNLAVGQEPAPVPYPVPDDPADDAIVLDSQAPVPIDNAIPIVPAAPVGDSWITDSLGDQVILGGEEEASLPVLGPDDVPFAYRQHESTLSWLPGSGDNLGWVDWETTYYQKHRRTHSLTKGITPTINLHWINGPDDIALPARVYDFVLGYQRRERIGPWFSYDVATSIGVYSDFEDSARDGVRMVSHAVGSLHPTSNLDFVFGVDYLDRDDLALLPVIGFQWRPQCLQDLEVRAIFPRPEISLGLAPDQRLYVRGQLGGGSWDIEFPNQANDVMTYRDVQILMGLERKKDGKQQRLELGYVFERQLEFRWSPQSRELDDGFVIRLVTLE